MRADPSKVRAVTDMEGPEDVSGVRRFLGIESPGKVLTSSSRKDTATLGPVKEAKHVSVGA